MLSSEYIREFGAGDLVFAEGSIGEHLYVVIDGHVAITRRFGADEVELARLGLGEFFGEMAVIEEAPRSATATALEDGTRLAIINQAQFIYLVSHQPVFALQMLEALSHRLREATDHRFHAKVAGQSA